MIEFLKAEARRQAYTVIWSWQGWKAAWATEASLRFWALMNAGSAGLAMALNLTRGERALIIGFGLLILVAELMNTAVEGAVNYISLAQDPRAKKAKDCGSAAVALTAIAAGVVWLILLLG